MLNKKINKYFSLSLMSAVSAFTFSAQASEHQGPNFKGNLSVGVLSVDTLDAEPWAFKADAGVDGMYILNDHLKIRYDLVADFAGEINGPDTTGLTWSSGDVGSKAEGDIYLHTARAFIMTDYGTFLIAPRLISGQWGQLYKNVDKFEYNRLHSQTGDISIFAQVEHAEDALAYISPAVGKHWRFIAAVLSTAKDNGEDADVFAARAVYDDGTIYAGIGNVWVTDSALPTDEDYNRTALTFGYDFGRFELGTTYEINQGHPAGDWDAFALTGEFDVNEKWGLTLGYASNELNDNDAVLAKVKYTVNNKAYFFLETGQYSEAVDNVAAGLNIKF